MNEPQPEFAVSKSYSLKIGHVGLVTDLAARLGKSPSAVVQAAIETYYELMTGYPSNNPPTPESK